MLKILPTTVYLLFVDLNLDDYGMCSFMIIFSIILVFKNQKTLALHILLDWDSLWVYNFRFQKDYFSGFWWHLRPGVAQRLLSDPRCSTCSVLRLQQQSSPRLLISPSPHAPAPSHEGVWLRERVKCWIPGRSDPCLDRGRRAACKHWSLSVDLFRLCQDQ